MESDHEKIHSKNNFLFLRKRIPIPNRVDFAKNIQAHFASIGYTSSENFKKPGPSYIAEEFIEESGIFSEPLEALHESQFMVSRHEAKKTKLNGEIIDV